MKNKALKKWLALTGRTHESWAREIGVSHMTVWAWANNVNRPHHFSVDSIREKTPDCPLLRRKPGKK